MSESYIHEQVTVENIIQWANFSKPSISPQLIHRDVECRLENAEHGVRLGLWTQLAQPITLRCDSPNHEISRLKMIIETENTYNENDNDNSINDNDESKQFLRF